MAASFFLLSRSSKLSWDTSIGAQAKSTSVASLSEALYENDN
jgi:hypothetical protein